MDLHCGKALLVFPSVCLHKPDHIVCVCVYTCVRSLYVQPIYLCQFQNNCPTVTRVSLQRLDHSVRPTETAFPVEATHSCPLPGICRPTMEQRDRITQRTWIHTHNHTLTSKQACRQAREETSFQGHETEAWMDKGILSHVATFRSQSWQACFGSSCSWSLEVSLMATGLELS